MTVLSLPSNVVPIVWQIHTAWPGLAKHLILKLGVGWCKGQYEDDWDELINDV